MNQMEANFLSSSLSPTAASAFPSSRKQQHRLLFFTGTGPIHLRLATSLRAASSSDGGGESNTDDPETKSAAQPRPPPNTLNIRYRSRSRKARQRQQEQEEGGMTGTRTRTAPPPPKDWEEMTLGEKAVELYVGEKGLLFWLNKFAYASIFIIIGGWILFRFVGPSLGLYQLDAPPLSPSSILKGSP